MQTQFPLQLPAPPAENWFFGCKSITIRLAVKKEEGKKKKSKKKTFQLLTCTFMGNGKGGTWEEGNKNYSGMESNEGNSKMRWDEGKSTHLSWNFRLAFPITFLHSGVNGIECCFSFLINFCYPLHEKAEREDGIFNVDDILLSHSLNVRCETPANFIPSQTSAQNLLYRNSIFHFSGGRYKSFECSTFGNYRGTGKRSHENLDLW